MLSLYRPQLHELAFRSALIGDDATMAYNAKWGGAIAFPRENWAPWFEKWLCAPENLRFYRYLYDEERRIFVGEAAYRFNEAYGVHTVSIIISVGERRRGYGREALCLLEAAAKERGITKLADDIAVDNPSLSLFLASGYRELWRDENCVFVEKVL